MAGVKPELIFVAGPQKHMRVVLRDREVIAGRSSRAGLQIQEPYVSRQQMKFTFTPDGWIVENLSDRRILINGKAYKPGKQILLGSGDTIGCGRETTLLFVDAPDDPASVLDAYRQAHPEAAPQPVPVAPPGTSAEPVGSGSDDQGPPTAPVPAEPEPEVFSFEPEARERKTTGDDEQAPTEEEAEAAKRKKRTRLYIIAFAGYALLMLGVIIMLARLKGDDAPVAASQAPPMLTSSDIRDALQSTLTRPTNASIAQGRLEDARQFYLRRSIEPENLYLAILNYRLYLAHRRAAERTFLPQDDSQYRAAVEELTERVANLYSTAYALEKAGKWNEAFRAFNTAMKYFNTSRISEDPEVQEVIVRNMRAHTSYVSRQMGEEDDD